MENNNHEELQEMQKVTLNEGNQTSETVEKKKKPKQEKQFSWIITSLLLIGTLVVSLVSGYFITTKIFYVSDAQKQINMNIDKYSKLVNKKPNDANNRVQLGYAYLQNGDSDNAISQFKTALGIDNKYYPALLNLSIAYYQTKDVSKAVEYASKAEKLNSGDFTPMFIKGSCLRQMKKYKDAKTELENAQKLAPDQVEVICEIGLLAEDQSDYAQATKIYKQALSLDPTYKKAIDGLARVKNKK